MARGRFIDKQISSNEDLAPLPIEARYLYQGLIIHADDEGRMKANPTFLKAVVFPFDEVIRVDTVKQWRDMLASIGVIKLYAAGGKEYLSHPNWNKWQPVRKDRQKTSDCPPDGNQVATNWQPAADINKVDGNQEEKKEKSPNVSPPALLIPSPSLPLKERKEEVRQRRSVFVRPSVEQIGEYCKERRNGIIPQQFFDHYESNGWRVGKNHMKDWMAAVRTWERNTVGNSINPAHQPMVPVDPEKLAAKTEELKRLSEREWERKQALKAVANGVL